jgi:hypothetical protein
MTSPAFSLKGVENGVILSDNPKVVAMGEYGHRLALKWTKQLKRAGLGRGHAIWWPATDGKMHRGPLSKMSVAEAWERFFHFWVPILRDIPDEDVNEEDGDLVLEIKPSTPAEIDFIPTVKAGIIWCNECNQRVGRRAVRLNLESAHLLIAGQTVEEGTQMQVDADLFGNFLHGNSAELALVQWNASGTNIIAGAPAVDADWAMGEGGEERWKDQERAIGILDRLGKRIRLEHDIDPAGEPPMDCFGRSSHNFQKMLAASRRKPHQALAA